MFISLGYYTGSVYSEAHLFKHFKGEGTANGSTVAIKTHFPGDVKKKHGRYQRAVLIVREPGEAIMAELNRQRFNQTARLNNDDFASKCCSFSLYFPELNSFCMKFVNYGAQKCESSAQLMIQPS